MVKKRQNKRKQQPQPSLLNALYLNALLSSEADKEPVIKEEEPSQQEEQRQKKTAGFLDRVKNYFNSGTNSIQDISWDAALQSPVDVPVKFRPPGVEDMSDKDFFYTRKLNDNTTNIGVTDRSKVPDVVGIKTKYGVLFGTLPRQKFNKEATRVLSFNTNNMMLDILFSFNEPDLKNSFKIVDSFEGIENSIIFFDNGSYTNFIYVMNNSLPRVSSKIERFYVQDGMELKLYTPTDAEIDAVSKKIELYYKEVQKTLIEQGQDDKFRDLVLPPVKKTPEISTGGSRKFIKFYIKFTLEEEYKDLAISKPFLHDAQLSSILEGVLQNSPLGEVIEERSTQNLSNQYVAYEDYSQYVKYPTDPYAHIAVIERNAEDGFLSLHYVFNDYYFLNTKIQVYFHEARGNISTYEQIRFEDIQVRDLIVNKILPKLKPAIREYTRKTSKMVYRDERGYITSPEFWRKLIASPQEW